MVKIHVTSSPRDQNLTSLQWEQLKKDGSLKVGGNVSYEILDVCDTEENTDETEVQESGAVETEYKNLINITNIYETVEEQVVRHSSSSSSNRSSFSDKQTPKKQDFDLRKDLKLNLSEISTPGNFSTPTKNSSSGVKNISICINDVEEEAADDVFNVTTSTPNKSISQKSYTSWNYHHVNSNPPSPGYKETSSIEIIPSFPRSPRAEISFFNTSNNFQRSYTMSSNNSLSPTLLPTGIHRSYTTNSSIMYNKNQNGHHVIKRSASCNDKLLPRRKRTVLDDYVIIELENDKLQWKEMNQSGVYMNLNLEPKFTHHLI